MTPHRTVIVALVLLVAATSSLVGAAVVQDPPVPPAAADARDQPVQELIAADATWLIDLDLAAALETRLGQLLCHAAAKHLRAGSGTIESELGIDLLRELGRITAYGTAAERNPPVVLVQGSAALEDLVEHARAQHAEITDAEVDGYDLLLWDDGAALVREAGDDARLLIAAPSAEALIAALRVIDGAAPSAADAEGSALSTAVRDGAFFAVRVPKVDAIRHQFPPGEGEAPRILRLAQTFSLEMGEYDGLSFLDTVFCVERENDAQDIAGLATGVLAMARMMAGDEPDLRDIEPLLRAMRVESEGSSVRVLLEIPADHLPAPDHAPGPARSAPAPGSPAAENGDGSSG